MVLDSFSLYCVATAHSQDAAELGRSATVGEVRLVTSAVALAVASTMRTCWDTSCDRVHPSGSPGAVREFHERGAIEVCELTPARALSAAQLYLDCAERRILGTEVMAACHCTLIAESRAAPLVSTSRAFYCYSAIPHAATSRRITLN